MQRRQQRLGFGSTRAAGAPLALLVLVSVLHSSLLPLVQAIEEGGGGSSSKTLASSSAESSSTALDSNESQGGAATSGGGGYLLVKDLGLGAVELRSVRTGRGANFCFQAPVMVTRASSEDSVNARCPQLWEDLSCSCVQGLSELRAWELHVAKRTSKSDPIAAPVPTTVAPDLLTVSSIGTFIVSDNLVSLKLVGESETTMNFELRLVVNADATNGSASTLVTTGIATESETSALTTVQVSNIDFSDVDIQASFLPAQVSTISLQNCNLATLSGNFLSMRHEKLLRLDLSRNRLRAFTSGLSENQTSTIKELNLSSNSFNSFPSSLVALKSLDRLYFKGNPVSNFSVTSDQFAQLAKLSVLEVDTFATPNSSAACSGIWQRIGDLITLCVLSSSPKSSLVVSDTAVSDLLFLAIGIPSCLLIAAVVLTPRRQYFNRRAGGKSDSFDISLLERTDEYSHERGSVVVVAAALTVDGALLRDPIIVMHRIPFKEVLVAERISQGGFGIVYSGVYKRRRVAIKRIRGEHSQDIVRVEAFLREICLMASLDHPRVVAFVGVAWADDSMRNLPVVTEFMDRGDLRDVLQSFKKRGTTRLFTWANHKAHVALQIAEALLYLHSLNPVLIHRDLKSKNVLLNMELEAKLSDFGISREWKIDDTHMTVGVGTSYWIAPEVLRGNTYDERADVFSFGVVLSELDTGEYPYWNIPAAAISSDVDCQRQQQLSILRKVARGQARPTFTPDCPQAILELADQCLQKDPLQRPTSGQVVYALHRILTEAESGDSSQVSTSD